MVLSAPVLLSSSNLAGLLFYSPGLTTSRLETWDHERTRIGMDPGRDSGLGGRLYLDVDE